MSLSQKYHLTLLNFYLVLYHFTNLCCNHKAISVIVTDKLFKQKCKRPSFHQRDPKITNRALSLYLFIYDNILIINRLFITSLIKIKFLQLLIPIQLRLLKYNHLRVHKALCNLINVNMSRAFYKNINETVDSSEQQKT